MTRSSALPSSRPRAGIGRFLPHWAPMLFIAAFLVVIGVNGTLIFFAQDTFSGLDTQSPYERGLDYNRTLAAEAAVAQLGWQTEAAIVGESDSARSLEVRITDRDGRPLDGLKMVAYLVRPSNQGLDLTMEPRPLGDGRYGASFVLPAPGQWELRLVADRNDVPWQHSERLFVK